MQDALFKSTIPATAEGQWLLDYLQPCIPYLTTEQWKTLLHNHQISLDGQPVTRNVQLHSGQMLSYVVNDYEEAPVSTEWSLLWENDEMMAVHKPANLPVNRTTRNVYNTLIQLVRRESPWSDAHLLNRLDLETAGVMLLAKSKSAALKWQKNLSALMQRKIYHAIVYGVPEWQTQSLTCELAERLDSDIRCKMYVVDQTDPGRFKPGKLSRTDFRVLRRGAGFSLIECEIFTGRKHQIRTQLAHLGHPIVGDKIYAHEGVYFLKRCQQPLEAADFDILLTQNHLLHAAQLTLTPNDHSSPCVVVDCHYSTEWQTFAEQVFTAD